MEDVRYEAEELSVAAAAVTIRWADGHESVWPANDLRTACPCAVCTELRAEGEPVWPTPGSPARLDVLDAKLHGAYAVTFEFSDGHQTGIYAWEILREACPCEACVKGRHGDQDREAAAAE